MSQKIITTILLTLFLLGCTHVDPNSKQNQSPDSANVPQDTQFLYDIDAKVGQKFGNMTLDRLEPDDKGKPLSEDNVEAEFSGEVSLNGYYYRGMNILDPQSSNDLVCFYLEADGESRNRLPIWRGRAMLGGDYPDYLCFSNSNYEIANSLLPEDPNNIEHGDWGYTEITIDSYIDRTLGTDTFDELTLKSVQKVIPGKMPSGFY